MSFGESTNVGEGKLRVLGLRRKIGPRIWRIMEHHPTEHTVVVVDQGGRRCVDDEMIVFLDFVVG